MGSLEASWGALERVGEFWGAPAGWKSCVARGSAGEIVGKLHLANLQSKPNLSYNLEQVERDKPPDLHHRMEAHRQLSHCLTS